MASTSFGHIGHFLPGHSTPDQEAASPRQVGPQDSANGEPLRRLFETLPTTNG